MVSELSIAVRPRNVDGEPAAPRMARRARRTRANVGDEEEEMDVATV
jgi:hypothetical protein